MTEKKQDPRYLRTQRDLKNALLDILKEKGGIRIISITEVALKAQYNRATFYAHYPNKEALMEEIMQEAIDGFIEAFRDPYKENASMKFPGLSSAAIKIFYYLEQNAELFTLLFNNKMFSGFQQRFRYAIEEVMSKELLYLGESFNKLNMDLYIYAHTYLILGMIMFWVENKFELSAEYMTNQLIEIGYNRTKSVKPKKKRDFKNETGQSPQQ